MNHHSVSIPLSQIGGLKSTKHSINHHQDTIQTIQLNVLPPLSLYIHWPWCVKKCPYCDFNSHEYTLKDDGFGVDKDTENAYIECLLNDLEAELPRIWGRRIESIFIGGGTPSLMRPQSLDYLLSAIRARLPFVDNPIEITLEVNPGTIEVERLKGFANAGVNRFSIGVQSFNDIHLKHLGRIHQGDEAKRAIELALNLTPKVNVDLMYGLPHQTLDQSMNDIEIALQSGIKHISAYHLTLEPNTYFNRYPPQLPDDDVCSDMQHAIDLRLQEAGFKHYEISAYAFKETDKPSHESHHNLNYWLFGDYIGIGAGAHGKISLPHQIIRTVKHKHPKQYLAAFNNVQHHNHLLNPFNQEERVVNPIELPFEFMLNALRLQSGFSLSLLQERTGIAYPDYQSVVKQLYTLENKGLLTLVTNNHLIHVCPTQQGHRFLNDVLAVFL